MTGAPSTPRVPASVISPRRTSSGRSAGCMLARAALMGRRRVTAQLRAAGRVVNRKRVERLMRVHQIAGIRRRRPKRTTIPARTAVTLPDLLGRDFAQGPPIGVGVRHHLHPHRRGLAVPRGRARLGQPPAVGLPDERPHRRPLGQDALDMAGAARGGRTAGIVFHSDRGSNY